MDLGELCSEFDAAVVGGWGRAGVACEPPEAEASDLGASPFGRRPQPRHTQYRYLLLNQAPNLTRQWWVAGVELA